MPRNKMNLLSRNSKFVEVRCSHTDTTEYMLSVYFFEVSKENLRITLQETNFGKVRETMSSKRYITSKTLVFLSNLRDRFDANIHFYAFRIIL